MPKFWTEVHDPWKARQLSPEAVRDLLVRHLENTGGFYTQVAERLGVDRTDYQRFKRARVLFSGLHRRDQPA